MAFRLLADENTSHRLVSACRHLAPNFPLVHIVNWAEGAWLGLDDTALLISCADYGYQSRLLTGFWQNEAQAWDWQNRIVYLPKSP